MKKALITGVFGQDGIYLANLLLKKNYKVFGIYKKNLNNLKISTIINRIKHFKIDIETKTH